MEMCRSKVKCNPCRIADLLPKRRNAQNLTPLYGFGAILGAFLRYERLYFDGGILTVRHSSAAVCRFRVTKKRRIATTLLSCSAYFVAGVLGIPLVHYAEERGEVVILRLVTGHAVIDCNKAYLLLGEQNLGIKADLKIVSAETAHILDDNCADFPGFGFCKHCLKSGTVEVTPCVTVIFQKIVCKKFVILKIHINCNLCYSIEK